jgi:hypothetical protein
MIISNSYEVKNIVRDTGEEIFGIDPKVGRTITCPA